MPNAIKKDDSAFAFFIALMRASFSPMSNSVRILKQVLAFCDKFSRVFVIFGNEADKNASKRKLGSTARKPCDLSLSKPPACCAQLRVFFAEKTRLFIALSV